MIWQISWPGRNDRNRKNQSYEETGPRLQPRQPRSWIRPWLEESPGRIWSLNWTDHRSSDSVSSSESAGTETSFNAPPIDPLNRTMFILYARTFIREDKEGERKKENLNHMLVADKNKTPRGNPLWLKACCRWHRIIWPHQLPTGNTHTPRLICFAASTPELSKATEPTWINADDLSVVIPGRPVAPGPPQNPTQARFIIADVADATKVVNLIFWDGESMY